MGKNGNFDLQIGMKISVYWEWHRKTNNRYNNINNLRIKISKRTGIPVFLDSTDSM